MLLHPHSRISENSQSVESFFKAEELYNATTFVGDFSKNSLNEFVNLQAARVRMPHFCDCSPLAGLALTAAHHDVPPALDIDTLIRVALVGPH
jgi:hypothetical protein